MDNANPHALLPSWAVKRDYTPATLLEDVTMEDGTVLPKDSDVCLLSLNGQESGRVLAVVYFPGGYGVNFGGSVIPAEVLWVPEFYETVWGSLGRGFVVFSPLKAAAGQGLPVGELNAD